MHQIVDNELETEFLDNLVEIESILKSSGTDIPTLSAENDTSFLVRSVSSTTSQMPSSVFESFLGIVYGCEIDKKILRCYRQRL